MYFYSSYVQHTTPQLSTTQHTTPHHSTTQHTTAHHTTPHHTTPRHSTTQHTTPTPQRSTPHQHHNTAQHSKSQVCCLLEDLRNCIHTQRWRERERCSAHLLTGSVMLCQNVYGISCCVYTYVCVYVVYVCVFLVHLFSRSRCMFISPLFPRPLAVPCERSPKSLTAATRWPKTRNGSGGKPVEEQWQGTVT